jgi:hypothetical protein
MADAATLSVLLNVNDQMTGELKKAEGVLQRNAATFRKVGIAATAAGAAVSAGMFIAVNAASNLEESTNAVNVAFGSAGKVITDFGRTASKTAGMSAADFNQLATTTGAMLQNFGSSADEAAQQTIELSQRAADLASVFNTDVSDAMAAIQSGMQGMALPLRRYAVDVTETSLELERMAQGIEKTVAEMTMQEKAQLRLSAIMSQSAKVAGDFVNTNQSFANSMRIIKSDITNLSAEIGVMLLPIIATVLGVVRNVVDVMLEWTRANPGLTKVLVLVTAAVGGLLLVLGPLLVMLPGIVAAAPAVGAALTVMFGPVGVAVVAAAALIVSLGFIITKLADIGAVSSQGSDEMQKLVEASNLFADEALPRVSKSASDFQSELEAINRLGEKFPEWANDMRQSLVQSLDASSSSVSDLEAEMMELGLTIKNTYETWRSEQEHTSSIITDMIGEEGAALAKRFEEEEKQRATILAEQRSISSQIQGFKNLEAEAVDVVTSAYTRQTQAVQGLSAEFSKASNMVEQRAEQFSQQQKPFRLDPGIFGPADGSQEMSPAVMAMLMGNFNEGLKGIMGGGVVNPVPDFKHGGIVPGRAGVPVPIIAHGGEEFLGVGGGRGGARAGAIINVNFNGPVFGEQDLKDRVSEIWLDVARAGGFEGVL